MIDEGAAAKVSAAARKKQPARPGPWGLFARARFTAQPLRTSVVCRTDLGWRFV